jgi:ABC-type multidrug transport system fused ATPase/permease subunit
VKGRAAARDRRAGGLQKETLMPLLDVFWAMLWFFLFFAWLMLLFSIFADLFRRDISGWAKAGWTVFLIVLPLLGALIYLIANGSEMQSRSRQQAVQMEQAQRDYIRSAAATSTSTAEELSKLAALRESGVLTEEEFRSEKAKVMAEDRSGAVAPTGRATADDSRAV